MIKVTNKYSKYKIVYILLNEMQL